jgi:plasmid stability protein
MADIIVRKLDKSVVEGLKARAALHGHSLEQEVRDMLIAGVKENASERRATADAIRAKTRWVPGTESTELVRADRDR